MAEARSRSAAAPATPGQVKPYIVTFNGGSLAATDVAQLAATSAGANALSGGSPTSGVLVRTRANGHAAITGLEDCTEASGCQAGVGSNTGGVVQFATSSPGPIAVDAEGNIYAANLTSIPAPRFAADLPLATARFSSSAPTANTSLVSALARAARRFKTSKKKKKNAA